MRVEKRLFKTLRLKPTTLNTNTLMANYLKEKPNIKVLDPEVMQERYGGIKHKFYNIGKERESSGYGSEDSDAGKFKEKRFAKPPEELAEDILNLFRKKDEWTMDEIKNEMPDQPDNPVET